MDEKSVVKTCSVHFYFDRGKIILNVYTMCTYIAKG